MRRQKKKEDGKHKKNPTTNKNSRKQEVGKRKT
jgi:hypothetical protein